MSSSFDTREKSSHRGPLLSSPPHKRWRVTSASCLITGEHYVWPKGQSCAITHVLLQATSHTLSSILFPLPRLSTVNSCYLLLLYPAIKTGPCPGQIFRERSLTWPYATQPVARGLTRENSLAFNDPSPRPASSNVIGL